MMTRSIWRSCCGVEVKPAEVSGRVGVVEPAAHRVRDRLRLLVNLLQHVVRVVAEFSASPSPRKCVMS